MVLDWEWYLVHAMKTRAFNGSDTVQFTDECINPVDFQGQSLQLKSIEQYSISNLKEINHTVRFILIKLDLHHSCFKINWIEPLVWWKFSLKAKVIIDKLW